MTRIKLCGLVRPEDVLAANALLPEYVGFVFAPKAGGISPPSGRRHSGRCWTPGSGRWGCLWTRIPGGWRNC